MKLTVVGCGDAFGSGGRLQTSYLVETAATRFLIDCGATALIGLNKLGIDPNSIPTIFISHLHGDHYAGLVWWLIHAQHVAKRTVPLTVAGPVGHRGALQGRGGSPVSRLQRRAAEIRSAVPGIRARAAARCRAGARDAVRGEACLRRAALCAAFRNRRQGAELHRRHRMGGEPGAGRAGRRPLHHGMLPVRRRAALPHELENHRAPTSTASAPSASCSRTWPMRCWPAAARSTIRASCWPRTGSCSTYEPARG